MYALLLAHVRVSAGGVPQDEVVEFSACGRIRSKASKYGRGGHYRILFFHAPHHHAHVTTLHDNTDAIGLNGVLYGLGNLLCEAFLDLESPREAIGNTRKLADSEHLVVGDVTDMAFPEEGQHVVFAEAVDLYVAHDNHVMATGLENCAIHDRTHILMISGCQEPVGCRDTLRGLD